MSVLERSMSRLEEPRFQLAPCGGGQIEKIIRETLKQATLMAALQAAHARGRNNGKFADALAVEAMREVLNRELLVRAEVVIGEGERDKAPMLYIGERLGPPEGEPMVEIAVDPLEGTNLCARNEPGAITVIAAAVKGRGSLMRGVDGYMEKIVLAQDLAQALSEAKRGPALFRRESAWLLDEPIEAIIHWIAQLRDKPVTDVVAMVLERDYNQELLRRLRQMNVQVKLIRDGDITAGLLALDGHHNVDIAVGRGAAPEGVITATMARVYRGYMEGRWWFPDNEKGKQQYARLQEQGVDTAKTYETHDLASGSVLFALTAVTSNDFSPGVRYEKGGIAETFSVTGRSESGTRYETKATHLNPPDPPTDWPAAVIED